MNLPTLDVHMVLEKTEEGFFLARGHGPQRPIVVEAESQSAARRGFLDFAKEQLVSLSYGQQLKLGL